MQTTPTHQRFIIERPRLIELLDSFESRIVLITAPAGYGKSTLARQWAAKRDNVLWYEATPASRDVAALAMGLARSSSLPEEAQLSLRARIDALANPDDHVSSLRQMLSSSLSELYGSSAPTLVIDETDVVLSAPSSSRFLHELLDSAQLRFIVIGRQRPPWVATRKLLYAEIAEIDRDQLAFTEPEAAQLLSALPGASTRAMWSRTKGWPAVLRLAVLTQNASLPDEPIGSSLHEYFAEELFEIASAELQARLPALALLPALRGSVLQLLLGEDHHKLQAEALEIGFLSISGVNEFDMHPLLRSFLAAKFEPTSGVTDCKELLLRLLDLREWDNAFALIARAQLHDYLPQLVARSLDSLLSEGRLTTLEDWVALGLERNVDSPDLYLLEAELSRRAGAFSAASAKALKAAEAYRAAGHPWTSRAFSIAGICAHLSRYSPDASEHYAKARAAAQSNEDARQAIWGQLLTSYTQEDAATEALLDEFERYVDADPAARLRLATGRFILACSRGQLETTVRRHLQPYIGLADSVRDPLIRSSFFYQISFGYILTGYYKTALEFVDRGEDEVRMQRLFFAQTHLSAARVAATIGLRRFKKAQSLVDELADLASSVDDFFEFANSRALQARLLICERDDERAAAVLRDWEATPVTALTAELAGLRALALVRSDIAESERLARVAIKMSGNAQAQSVAYAARAVIDLRAGLDPDRSRLPDFEDVLLDRQNYDALVLAYRSHPSLLAAVKDRGRIPHRRLLRLIAEAQDAPVAASVGIGLPSSPKTSDSLSLREQEVFDLLRRGRKNKEIAATLFITEATVKVHVRHILEKLNVRSRTEAVARYHDT